MARKDLCEHSFLVVEVMLLKRLILSGVAICFVGATQAQAERPYGAAGCGLGSLVIKEDGFMQVLAATTNGTSGSQTFGISTGTSNCVTPEKAAALRKQEAFVQNNLRSLEREVAQGSGETLDSFAEVLGCDSAVTTEFRRAAQANYNNIFSQPGAIAVLEGAKKVFEQQPELKNQCAWLI